MKTPVIQCSPCYSAVSALLMNPLPDRSNYLPLLPHLLAHSGSITSLVSSGQTLYQAALLGYLLSLFSLSLSPLCSLSQSSLYTLSTIPSFSSDQFFVLKDFKFHYILFMFLHSVSHHDMFFLIMHSISL